MTNVLRTKYASLITALVICVSNIYADPCCPAAVPCCSSDTCCEEYWVSADLLYLRACEDGFGCDFGTTEIAITPVSGRTITDITESDDDIDFNWNAGFRLGAGYGYDSGCWNPAIYWTHFNETAKGHDGENHAHWKLKFNELDAVIAYKIDYCNGFSFKPFFGARYARIDQTISSHLEATITTTSTGAVSTVISTKKDHENFWGAGPLLGFEGDFDLGCGFSVYGNLAGNVLFGEFKTHFNDTDLFTLVTNNCHSHSKGCSVLTGYDAGLGIRYAFGCEMPVLLQLGLEQHAYFDYNKLGCNGDLNLYGVNLSVGVQF